MSETVLTCIECPVGCEISVKVEDGKVFELKGNACPRGKAYAEAEVVYPKRVVTTTVKTDGGKFLPVKSNLPIPKDKIFDAMKKINTVTATLPVKIGDVIIKDIYDGIDIVACQNIEKR